MGVTAAMAFSSQSVMTLAKADDAGAISATATSTLRRLAGMVSSLRIDDPPLRIGGELVAARICGK